MAGYDVGNIIPINILLTPAGLGYANFASALIYATPDQLASGVSFNLDTYRDYGSLVELAADFDTESEVYMMATRWFANLPSPLSVTVWMWDETDTVVEASTKAASQLFRYFQFWDHAVTDVQANATALADWCDANTRYLVFATSDAGVIDPQIDTDIMSVMQAKGNRRVTVCYKDPASIALDPTQIYAPIQLAASFYKFRPTGLRTAITGEFQVLPGVIGDELSTTAYNAIKAKGGAFFTKIELKGQTDNSRVINSRSMSSYGEFMDDVYNLDVLANYLQVDGYNYIAGTSTKRPLTPQGYAGYLATLEETAKRFYTNGVLGEGTYADPETGDPKLAKFGYAMLSKPEDVLSISAAQRRNREYPDTNMIVILSRAGHSAAINLNVE